MEAPRRLPLDTPQSPVSELLLHRAVLDYMNRELAISVAKHGKTLNFLAARPQMEIPQAVSRQVCPTDPGCEFLKTHGMYPAA
jgi:hypothetical protein